MWMTYLTSPAPEGGAYSVCVTSLETSQLRDAPYNWRHQQRHHSATRQSARRIHTNFKLFKLFKYYITGNYTSCIVEYGLMRCVALGYAACEHFYRYNFPDSKIWLNQHWRMVRQKYWINIGTWHWNCTESAMSFTCWINVVCSTITDTISTLIQPSSKW